MNLAELRETRKMFSTNLTKIMKNGQRINTASGVREIWSSYRKKVKKKTRIQSIKLKNYFKIEYWREKDSNLTKIQNKKRNASMRKSTELEVSWKQQKRLWIQNVKRRVWSWRTWIKEREEMCWVNRNSDQINEKYNYFEEYFWLI